MSTKFLTLCLLTATRIAACKKSEVATDSSILELPVNTVYTSLQSRNLNLIYFVPNRPLQKLT
ncbi:hypothetical protein [Pedobacter gandavensis]|uniref:FAS1 domain-containing protein n=1 Tax=Pedobacter gandavensis TaxID=2679963 RepID=A0ABR6EVZ6_9SPHI|nr:hypothetical protein [Pedobacter gandavensis]MBB2149453.1 hypothetical protein [Pedobacter gandavensis]